MSSPSPQRPRRSGRRSRFSHFGRRLRRRRLHAKARRLRNHGKNAEEVGDRKRQVEKFVEPEREIDAADRPPDNGGEDVDLRFAQRRLYRARRFRIELKQSRLDGFDGPKRQMRQSPTTARQFDDEHLLRHAASPKLSWNTWPAAFAEDWKSSSGITKSSSFVPNASFSATQL